MQVITQLATTIKAHPYGDTNENFVPYDDGAAALSPQELAQFEKKGWLGAYPLLTPVGVERASAVHAEVADKFMLESLLPKLQGRHAFDEQPWAKSKHAYVQAYCDIVRHPAIVNRVAAILGPDVIAWGSSVAVRQPGQKHRWHVDIEHDQWPGVTVFIGLTGSSANSSLKVINGTQKLRQLPQNLGIDSDKSALTKAARLGAPGELETVVTEEGEFFIFDGHLWHGSLNTNTQTRMALIAQYARPDAHVKVPLTWNEPIRWLDSSPPCILVSGQDKFGINRIVG